MLESRSKSKQNEKKMTHALKILSIKKEHTYVRLHCKYRHHTVHEPLPPNSQVHTTKIRCSEVPLIIVISCHFTFIHTQYYSLSPNQIQDTYILQFQPCNPLKKIKATFAKPSDGQWSSIHIGFVPLLSSFFLFTSPYSEFSNRQRYLFILNRSPDE